MTAQVFDAVVKPASTFSTCKKHEGAQVLDATAVAALVAVTTANTVADVLDILSATVARGNEVGPNQIGLATSTLL